MAQNYKKPPQRWWIYGSIALNIFLAGFLIAHVAAYHSWEMQPGIHHGVMERLMTADQRAVLEPHFTRVRTLREELHALIKQDSFDEAALRAKFSEIDGEMMETKSLLRDAFIYNLSAMSPAQRKAIVFDNHDPHSPQEPPKEQLQPKP